MKERPKPPEDDPCRSIEQLLADWHGEAHTRAYSIGEKRAVTVEWQSAVEELAELREKVAKADETDKHIRRWRRTNEQQRKMWTVVVNPNKAIVDHLIDTSERLKAMAEAGG